MDFLQKLDPSIFNASADDFFLGADKSAQSSRDLNSRIKILEIYTLHVLPRNYQWQYAQELISSSDILDAETKELFLQHLDSLKRENGGNSPADSSPNLGMVQREIIGECLERNRRAPELKHNFPSGPQLTVEHDYGIEIISKSLTTNSPAEGARTKAPPSRPKSLPTHASASPEKSVSNRGIARGDAMINTVQHIMSRLSCSVSKQPLLFVRFSLFLIGLILAFSGHDVRKRMKFFLWIGWEKLRRTAGMGTKVSYI